MIYVIRDDTWIIVDDGAANIILTRDDAIKLRDQLAQELQKMPIPSERSEG